MAAVLHLGERRSAVPAVRCSCAGAQKALQELHGQVGAAIQVDVLKIDDSTRSALLRVNTTYGH